MTMSPTSARGSHGGRTRFIETTTPPRGSKRSICLRSSALVSRYFIRSNMVSPGGGITPPTITRPTSPSAWASTTVTARFHLIGLSTRPEKGDVKGPVTDQDAVDHAPDGLRGVSPVEPGKDDLAVVDRPARQEVSAGDSFDLIARDRRFGAAPGPRAGLYG